MDQPAVRLNPTERRRVLNEQFAPWTSRTLSQHIDHVASRYETLPLVITDDREYTYRDIQQWSIRLAAGLVELGIKPGEHVALVMANHPEFVALKFAIARVGAVCVPINFLLREQELTYVLRQSQSVALITMDRFRASDYVAMLDTMMPGWELGGGGERFAILRDVVVFSAEGRSRRWRSVADIEALGTDDSAAKLDACDRTADPSQPADILYTSGTTGSPKGVLLTHDMLVRTAFASANGRGLRPGHRVVFSLPMYHVFGYIECLLALSFAGGAVVPRLAFDPVDILSAVPRHRANEIACVPTMTFALLDEARRNQYDFSTINVMYSSGGPQPESIFDEMKEVFGPDEMVHGYGQTETTAAMTASAPEASQEELRRTNGRPRAAGIAGDATLGGVLAVYKVIDIETGADLPAGTRGQLVARGPAITPGYFDKPDETAAAFDENGWFKTGDVGIIDAQGRVVLLGRVKDTYRCGGEMVMPKEIENLLVEHPGVTEAHVVGVPHPRMGEVGCAVIVVAGAGARPTEEELIELCRSRLARFKVPAHVVFMAASDLPVTVTGRVQKFRLAEAVTKLLNPAS
jgi:fatty-acyl-CoA synthase